MVFVLRPNWKRNFLRLNELEPFRFLLSFVQNYDFFCHGIIFANLIFFSFRMGNHAVSYSVHKCGHCVLNWKWKKKKTYYSCVNPFPILIFAHEISCFEFENCFYFDFYTCKMTAKRIFSKKSLGIEWIVYMWYEQSTVQYMNA